MAKLSISLPNNAQITLESEEAELVHEVLGMVLSGMPLDSMTASVPAPPSANGHVDPVEKGTDTLAHQTEAATAEPAAHANGDGPRRPSSGVPPATVAEVPHTVNGAAVNGNGAPPVIPVNGMVEDVMDVKAQPQQARDDFRAFCQSLNPMGDMRRVVVAAEGASRFFSWDGVSADDLGELFDLAGWRRANSFTQTIRNAARSKFGWLERIPGRSGRYAATDVGRSIIFGS